MTQKDLDMVKQLEGTIEKIAGKETAKKILEGNQPLKPNSNKEKVADYTKKIVENMDALIDEPKRVKILESCGENCAKLNARAVERLINRRKKYPSLEKFLDAEQKKPMTGTKLIREGNIIHFFYVPQEFSQSMRCFCSLFRDLPANQTVSLTYCNCSKALVQKMWELVFEKPTKVELVKSAISGASECEFKVCIP